MKQRISAAAIALALALGMAVLAGAPANAAPSCRVMLTVIHSGSTEMAKVDGAGCNAVRAYIRASYPDGSRINYYGVVNPTTSVSGWIAPGATSIELYSIVQVTPTSTVRTISWAPSQSGTWRTVS